MSKAIVMEQTGGAEVLKMKKVKVGKPGPGQVLVRQTAVGVNFIDIYHRTGIYPIDLPGTPGIEACGVVVEVGEGVEGFKPDQRVAYATAPSGGYAEMQLVDEAHLVDVPDFIEDNEAAAMLAKGMTAHYLLCRTFRVAPGNTILVHAVTGGVGQILCQWGKHKGATIIGTVGSDEKRAVAEEIECDHILNYNDEDFVAQVLDITKDDGVPVVYDGVGKSTFQKSLDCLGYFGLMVSYGQASGAVEPFDALKVLGERSLFLTRPSLFHYKGIRMELVLSASEVFAAYDQEHFDVEISNVLPLKDAAKAHQLLESRKTTGSTVLAV